MKVILKMEKEKDQEKTKNNKDRYIGEWKNDLYHGKGVYFYDKGDRYEGDFQFGTKEGKGIAYYQNGKR